MTDHHTELDRLTRQIQFILEIDKLKSILRQTRLLHEERRENSAEHSWHIALAALLLADYANQPVNALHVAKMLLIHDIVEIDAGDTFAYSGVTPAEQQLRERTAAIRLFGLLPADQNTELLALWEEFDARETPEARFANAIDRLLPTLHNYHGNGGTWAQYTVTLDRVLRRLEPIQDGSTALWHYVQPLLQDAVAQGLIHPPQP